MITDEIKEKINRGEIYEEFSFIASLKQWAEPQESYLRGKRVKMIPSLTTSK